MRVLFVHSSALGSFGEAAIQYYPAFLAVAGYSVGMVARSGGDSSFHKAHDIRVWEVEDGQSWYKKLAELSRNWRPDIVHVYLYSGCGLVPLVMGRRQQTKYVLDIRSPLLRTSYMRLLHRLKNLFEPLFFDVVASHGIESAWTQVGRRRNLYLLPPGVDFSAVDPRVPASRADVSESSPLRLVYIGSLDRLRKPGRMIEAVMLAAGSCSVTLDIFGDGSERSQLEGYLESSNNTALVRFRGVVERSELLRTLGEFDAGLAFVPGGMYEPAPALKTLEYLACGLPVIATDTFGNRMFVEDGRNGILAKEDPVTLSRAIIRLANSENLCDSLRSQARASVAEFDWKTLVEKRLLPLYGDLLAR